MGLAAGAKLGPYEITGPLGAGGMGEVYRARDSRHNRTVAVKVLQPEAYRLSGSERFLREIRIAAQLTHPHILPLVDSGEQSGVLFYVMPYIEGETLREQMTRAGQLPISEGIVILRHILDALAYAHGRGVVHRDIKPENVLLSNRHALVTDFGVAKALDNLSNLGGGTTTAAVTASGMILGTPAYMAPEQVSGDAVDHRADLYAAGITAYEMFTQRLPFQAATAQQMMAAHLAKTADEILHWRPEMPPRLARAIMKCLEKDAGSRWQTAGELLAEVEATTTETRRTPAILDVMNEVVAREFTLTERVCRRLNRATLDPRIIGDHLTYVDNQVRSDVLVFFLHGLGLDHGDFEPILKRLKYRGVSPTLYGGEPQRRGRISLSLADHVVILREWLRDVVERLQPAIVVMVGFSLGADMGFQLLVGSTEQETPQIDGFLSLECNLSLETCFASRVLANIASDRPEMSVSELRRFGDMAASLEDWLNIHEYLVRVLRKFQGDIGVLQRAAADIVNPFKESPGFEIFARWFREARKRTRALRLVFSNDQGSMAALAKLKLENLDGGILGEEYPESVFAVVPNANHFALMRTEHVLRQIEEVVGLARAVKRSAAAGGALKGQ
jgi:serine/threonine protein kinase